MTSSFDRNIARLKSAQERNLRQRRSNTIDRINNIDEQVKEQVSNIGKASDLLVGKRFGSPDIASGEGGIIPYRHVKYIQEQTGIAHEAEKEDRIARVNLLKNHLEGIEDADTASHIVKKHALLNGAYYHEASRFTELSPHAQAAYARRKTAIYKNSEADKLKYWTTKNTDKFSIKGIKGEFIPNEVFENNLYPPDLKESLLQIGINEIRKQNGIDGFSNEFLELAGINDYIGEDGQLVMGSSSTAIEKIMKDVRKNYNVESSNRDIELYLSEFEDNLPTSENPNGTASINRIWIQLTGLMGKENKPMTGAQAWQHIKDLLVSEMVNNPFFGEPELRTLFEEIDPNSISKKNPKGLPYYETHRGKFDDIVDQYITDKEQDLSDREKKLKFKGKEYLISIVEQINDPNSELGKLIAEEGGLSTGMVQDILTTYRSISGDNSGTMPALLADLMTVQDIDQNEIIDRVRRVLIGRPYLTQYDIEGATPATIQKLKEEHGADIFSRSALIAGNTGKEFKTTTKDIIDRAIRGYYNLGDGSPMPWNYTEIYNRLDKHWVDAYQDALSKKFSPAQAANLANQHVQHLVGLRPNAEGVLPDQQQIDALFRADPYKVPDNNEFARKLNSAKDLIDSIIKRKEAGDENVLFDESSLIYKKGSKELEELIKYADSEGAEGSVDKLYIELARLYPRLGTWEDLINQQLVASGHSGLKSYSAFRQAMTVDNLAEFHRLINFKGGPTALYQAKVDAKDNSSVGIVEKVDEQENEAYDWRAAAIETVGPPPVKPEEGKLNSKGKPSLAHVKAMEKYENDLKEWEAAVNSLIPARLNQGDPLTRTRREQVGRGSYKNIFEVYLNGEWRQMNPKQYKLLLKKIKEIGKGNFNYQEYNFIPNEKGGFTIEKKDSYLQSYWNNPGSPLLNPLIADYANELYNANIISV